MTVRAYGYEFKVIKPNLAYVKVRDDVGDPNKALREGKSFWFLGVNVLGDEMDHSFIWYVWRREEVDVPEFLKNIGVDYDQIKTLSEDHRSGLYSFEKKGKRVAMLMVLHATPGTGLSVYKFEI